MKRRTQIIRGVEYVYEDRAYWNPNKKNATHERKYIGKMVNGEFVPNKTYKLEQQLREQKKRRPKKNNTCKREFYGDSYLLEQIANKTGILEDLREAFPFNYRELLTLAFYLVLNEGQAMYRFERWALTHYTPSSTRLTSQRISEQFEMVNEENKMEYFKLQAKRRSEKEYLAFDTTSISSYSKLIKQAKYGLNKDGDKLPQINLALLFGEKSRLPVYYRKLPGNILDVKTVEKLINAFKFIDMEKLNLVMDRGFYSEKNINDLLNNNHNFLIGLKGSTKIAKEGFKRCYDDMMSIRHYDQETELYMQTEEVAWGDKKLYVHYYYNDQRGTDDRTTFLHHMFDYKEELQNGSRDPLHESSYTKFFTTKGADVEFNDEAIKEARKYAGYFALMSNDVKDPREAIKIYRSKDMIEKAFGNLKERLDMRRMSVASEESLEGKLFVQFIALSLLSYIKKAMDDHQLFKNYTLQSLLDELSIIEIFRSGSDHYVSEITKKQASLFSCMDVPIPT